MSTTRVQYQITNPDSDPALKNCGVHWISATILNQLFNFNNITIIGTNKLTMYMHFFRYCAFPDPDQHSDF